MSNSVQPHRQQPTRLLCPWDSPGKNTGMGCHFLLQSIQACMHAKSFQSCPTLCNPIDGSPPGSSVPGIPQADHPTQSKFSQQLHNWACICVLGFCLSFHPKLSSKRTESLSVLSTVLQCGTQSGMP